MILLSWRSLILSADIRECLSGIQKNNDSVVALKEPTDSLAENANYFLPHIVSLNSYNLEVSMVTILVLPGKKRRLRDSTPNHTANK